MNQLEATKELFDELIQQAESMLTAEDREILRKHDKSTAATELHFGYGSAIRSALGLWKSSNLMERIDAIALHASDGLLIGFDADGASLAVIEYLWDKEHAGDVNATNTIAN